MRKMLLILGILLFPSLVIASPWLACDPYVPTAIQPNYFYVTIDGGTPAKVTHIVDPVGWKLYDLASVSVGSHQAKVKACVSSTEWGEACSAEVPFDFVRPAPPINPAGIKLIK